MLLMLLMLSRFALALDQRSAQTPLCRATIPAARSAMEVDLGMHHDLLTSDRRQSMDWKIST